MDEIRPTVESYGPLHRHIGPDVDNKPARARAEPFYPLVQIPESKASSHCKAVVVDSASDLTLQKTWQNPRPGAIDAPVPISQTPHRGKRRRLDRCSK